MEFLEMMNFIGFSVDEEKRRILDDIVRSMVADEVADFDINYIDTAAEIEGIYLTKSDYDYLFNAFMEVYR